MATTVPYDRCAFVTRAVEFCNRPAIVTFRYGLGIGACKQHLAPVLLWCMEKNGRGESPERPVEAVPTWRWAELELERS